MPRPYRSAYDLLNDQMATTMGNPDTVDGPLPNNHTLAHIRVRDPRNVGAGLRALNRIRVRAPGGLPPHGHPRRKTAILGFRACRSRRAQSPGDCSETQPNAA
jgi:hypothetical protein